VIGGTDAAREAPPRAAVAAGLARVRPGVRRAIVAALAALVAMGLVLAVLSQWDQLPSTDLDFSPGWAVLAVAALLASELYHAALWRMVLHRLGAEIGPITALSVWSLSSLGRYLPPGLLMPAVRVAGASTVGVAARVCLASMAYEAAFSLLGALIVATLLLTEVSELSAVAAGVGAAIVLLVAVHPAVFSRLSNAALRRLGRDELPTVLDTRTIAPFTLAYAGSFALVGLGVYATAEAIHPVDASLLPVAVASFSVGFLVSLAAFFVPGGLGVREAGLAGVLSLAIPFELALSVSVAVRLVQIALELLVAGVSTLLSRRARPALSTS
jgi:glycosyltransferase 2 family protein